MCNPPEVSFILISPISGQFTLTFDQEDAVSFLLIKRYACDATWPYIKDNPLCFFPVLSTSSDENDVDAHINEDLPTSVYNLHNGGVIFLHYILFDIQNVFDQ